ncbi:MAG: hypothetical protein HOD60_06310 [Candidatus Nitrosopelagicus sp.]|nr:hypothetical protein [Candidatus Nitrosopelagicus sp.]
MSELICNKRTNHCVLCLENKPNNPQRTFKNRAGVMNHISWCHCNVDREFIKTFYHDFESSEFTFKDFARSRGVIR